MSRERRGAATPARSRRHRCASQGQRQARSRGHRGARSRAPLGGNWAALAPQASVHSRHGWAVVHAEKMCPTGRVRSHCAAERSAGATTRSLEVVPGAAVREFSCIAETCWLPSLCSLLHCGCRRYPRRAGAACLRASKWLQCLGCPPGPGVAGMWGRGVAALRRPAPAALVPARRMSSRSAFQLPWESKPQEISKVRAYSRPARGGVRPAARLPALTPPPPACDAAADRAHGDDCGHERRRRVPWGVPLRPVRAPAPRARLSVPFRGAFQRLTGGSLCHSGHCAARCRRAHPDREVRRES